MRPARAAAAALVALALAAPPARAYFEDVVHGARGTSMGQGAIAVVRDASALHWNPAALSALRRPEAIADYRNPYGLSDLNIGALAVAAPAFGAGWAAGWHRLAVRDAYAEDLFTLAAGRVMLERGAQRLAVGAAFKLGRVSFPELFDPAGGGALDLPDQSKGSLDLGVLWTTPWPMDVAWVARDVLRPRYELVPGTGGDVLEPRHELAAGLRWNRESTISLGWAQPEDGAPTFNAGLEILFFDVFAIRSGVTNLSNVYRSQGSPTEMQFTGGFGVFHKGYQVDAAATTNRDLGASYHVTLRVPFGGSTLR
uniref:PorV/PorQ family protein n=1 Tax=Eiseniibacteriota bacterium TaxID=2212470 RepID=A0A832MMP5_UNCEI